MPEPKVTFATVRDSYDCWDIECRFDDGQKFAAVEVDYEHKELAHRVADALCRAPDMHDRIQRFAREARARARARRPLIAIDFGGSISIGRWDFRADFSTRRPIRPHASFEWECEQACWTVGGMWIELNATRDDAGQPLR